MSATGSPDYDEKAAARIINVSPRTLRRWRMAKLVGHYRTPTGRVRYTLDDLLAVQSGSRVPAVAANGRACPQLAACVPSTDNEVDKMMTV